MLERWQVLYLQGGDYLNEGQAEFWIFKQTLSSISYIYPIIFSVGFLLTWFYYDKRASRN